MVQIIDWEPLAKSTNSRIMTIEKSWIVRIDIWKF